MIQPGIKICIILKCSGIQMNAQIISLILHLLLLALFMIIALNLQKQHRKFQKSYIGLKDDPNYFVLKSWRLLQNRTLPQAFGVTFLRKREKVQYKLDVITMLVSIL